jgi:DNA-directed RNA polymerase I and III subunit RPAC1
MALDFVTIEKNTGVMPDEVLAHRFGLIPLNADPAAFGFLPAEMTSDTPDDPSTTLLFGLHVVGGEGETVTGGEVAEFAVPPTFTGPSGVVYSGSLVWIPLEGQERLGPFGPLHENVPITKLRPGHRIEVYIRAIKGTGETHAKFSPVATASYRLLPRIAVDPQIPDNKKRLLVATCPVGVFDIEESGDLAVANARACTTCRECIRVRRLAGLVRVDKEPNHYEFTVESIGARPAHQLVREALQILRERCAAMKQALRDGIPD